MTQPISCVLLIPEEHQAEVNIIAQSMGYGPGNLGVNLLMVGGAKWYGCHTWCSQAFLDRLDDLAQSNAAIAAMVISAIPEGDPDSNWSATLLTNGLIMTP